MTVNVALGPFGDGDVTLATFGLQLSLSLNVPLKFDWETPNDCVLLLHSSAPLLGQIVILFVLVVSAPGGAATVIETVTVSFFLSATVTFAVPLPTGVTVNVAAFC